MRKLAFSPLWTVLALTAGFAASACDAGTDPKDPKAGQALQQKDAGTAPDDAKPTPGGWHSPGDTPQGCNPVAPEWDCLLPYPSDFFVVPDASLPGGRRVVHSAAALPQRADPDRPPSAMDVAEAFAVDGFSLLPQIAVRIPGGVDPAELLRPYQPDGTLTADLAPSLQPGHRTLLLDAEQGQAAAHVAELDPRPDDPSERLLMIRPAVRLAEKHHYVVALRLGLKHPDGTPVQRPATFAQLVAGTYAKASGGGDLQAYYDAKVFAPLQKAGVARKDLLLAWDFTTASEAALTRDLLAVRDAMAVQPPVAVTVTAVQDDVSPQIARRVEGLLTVPLFLDQAGPGGRLHRDAQGKVQGNGQVQVPFTALVPRSLWEGKKPGPARVIQFGHGFFGTRAEVDKGFVPQFADFAGVVVVAVDWWGMSTPDVAPLAASLIFQPAKAMGFVDRVHQGMANQMALTAAAKGPLGQLSALQKGGKPLVDPSQVYYYGISMGHILGGTLLAVSPHLDRAAFSVGGAGFGLMMSRAAPFTSFAELLQSSTGTLPGAMRVQLLLAPALDRIDPVTYAPLVLQRPLADGPGGRQILVHVGLADTQVPNLASHVHARALGLPLLQPAVRKVWGLPDAALPAASGVVEFDLHEKTLDIQALAPKDNANPVHTKVRGLQASMQQVDQFLRAGGQIVQTCQGVCDPE